MKHKSLLISLATATQLCLTAGLVFYGTRGIALAKPVVSKVTKSKTTTAKTAKPKAGAAQMALSRAASDTVAVGKATEIGNLSINGWKLSIPAGTFSNKVKVTVTKASQSGRSLLTMPINIQVDNLKQIRLNQPVKITMKLDAKNRPNTESFDRTVMAYWNGVEWERIIPDPVRLSAGYLEMKTWHFSSFSGSLMTKEDQIKYYAKKMAVENWSDEAKQPALVEKIKAVCNDYFNGINLKDSKTREMITDRVIEMNVMPVVRERASTGDMTKLTLECSRILAEATVDLAQEHPLVKEGLMEGMGKLGTLTQGVEALGKKDYKTALVEFTDLGVTVFGGTAGGAVTAIKSVGDLSKVAVEQGIVAWKDYEMECAYKAYAGLAKEGAYGYKLQAGDWDTLRTQMRGYYIRLLSEKKEAWRKLHGMEKLSDAETKMLESYVDADLKEQFDKRLSSERKIEAKAAEYEKILKSFKDVKLLNRLEYGYKYDMTIDQRLRSLFTIRQVILDMVDGNISVFGRETDRESNLSFAVAMWLGYGKDRAGFYDWMRKQGYLKKLGSGSDGYWKLVRTIDNEFEPSKSDDNYDHTWSKGGGSYTYRCQTKFDHNYTGSNHDTCKGEFVENVGTATSPKNRYAGGEQVVLKLSIKATTSKHICFHLGAFLGASITPINKDKPFAAYGSDTSLYDVTEKHQKSYISTYKNDTNTGYEGMDVEVGGKMPSGRANGDKVYILVGFGGGNETLKTAYEYEWHKW